MMVLSCHQQYVSFRRYDAQLLAVERKILHMGESWKTMGYTTFEWNIMMVYYEYINMNGSIVFITV